MSDDTRLKEEIIFMFSKAANAQLGDSIVLDQNGGAHVYTAAFSYDNVSFFDWDDAQHAVTIEVFGTADLKIVQESGEPVNQDKWQEWGYNPQ